MQVANALDHCKAHKFQLVIPWLMGARYDRIMKPGDSFDLQVVANVINSLGFDQVHLFDVHSDVATLLIKNSKSHTNQKLLEYLTSQNPNKMLTLICPDAGAAKKLDHIMRFVPVKQVVHCVKKRDLSTGKISLKVLEPELADGEDCVIVDDICDGGATFLAISEQIPLARKRMLVVSHGIFSKGFMELYDAFNTIITSDSYFDGMSNDKIHVVPLNL